MMLNQPFHDTCDNCGGNYIKGRRDEHSCENHMASKLVQEITTGDFERKLDAWLASAQGRHSRLRIEYLRYLRSH
jgi:hypothetical protein